MTTFILKKGQESFTIVDGESAGRIFLKDLKYDNVPDEVQDKFEVPGKEVIEDEIMESDTQFGGGFSE